MTPRRTPILLALAFCLGAAASSLLGPAGVDADPVSGGAHGGDVSIAGDLSVTGDAAITGDVTSDNYTVTGFVFLRTEVLNPCSGIDPGAIFYNGVSGGICYCDGSATGKKASDGTSCF